MADNDCGCSGSSSTPPGTRGPAASRSVASAFGGNVAVRRSKCGPVQCPQPPLSEAEERSPYCADWVALLTTEVAGKLLIAVESCLFFLKSKCSGAVWFDAATEQVSIRFPDFVSSLPKENNYGFLAKVVPTIRKVCVDGVDSCEDEVHQELAAQVMGESNCGRLMLARNPLCGEIPPGSAGNADDQVHVDYLEAPYHEDVNGCPLDFRFLGAYMGDRGDANKTPCLKWSLMRRLKLRLSQWGLVAKGDPIQSSSKQLVIVPVVGGDAEDPCYELRALEEGTGGLPSDPNNCDTLIYRGKGTDTAGWKAEPAGLRYHPLDAPVQVLSTTGSGAAPITLPSFPTNACGKIVARFQGVITVLAGPSGSSTGLSANIGAYRIAFANSSQNNYFHAEAVVSAAAQTVTISKSGSGTTGLTIELLGYEY